MGVYIYMVVWNGFVEMEIVFQNQYIYSCSLSFDREFFLIYRKNIHLKVEKNMHLFFIAHNLACQQISFKVCLCSLLTAFC